MKNKKMRPQQKTFRGELVKEESPRGLWDLHAKGKKLRQNPYKTPPDNLTDKTTENNIKG